jgi:hypothetical protein
LASELKAGTLLGLCIRFGGLLRSHAFYILFLIPDLRSNNESNLVESRLFGHSPYIVVFVYLLASGYTAFLHDVMKLPLEFVYARSAAAYINDGQSAEEARLGSRTSPTSRHGCVKEAREAVKIADRLATSEPATYWKSRIETWDTLSLALEAAHQPEKGLAVLKEGIKIRCAHIPESMPRLRM